MIKIISKCPACDSDLKISALKCPNCNLELRNDFTLSKFDMLNENQSEFLISFLKNRGNMGAVQDELGRSYPTAKKKLDDLLMALDLAENTQNKEEEFIDMTNLTYTKDSIKASDIIKQKLIENGGRVVVYSMRNQPSEIKFALTEKLLQAISFQINLINMIFLTLLLNFLNHKEEKHSKVMLIIN